MPVKFLVAIAFSFLLIPLAVAQDLQELDRQIRSRKSQLDKIRNDIRQVERRIAEKEQAEEDALVRLMNMEEKISLTSRLVRVLNREIDELTRETNRAETSIARREQDIADMQQKLAARFTHIYKQRRASTLELIFTSRDWSQATYRAKYLKSAADYDRHMTAQVKREIAQLQAQKRRLQEDRHRKQLLLKEKNREEVQLLADKRVHKKQIERLKKDRRRDEKILLQKKQAAVELERILTNLEFDRERRAKELAAIRKERELAEAADVNFYKGKLPWPTQGRVTARFGNQRNPELLTITENPGIDIRSQPGTAVTSVLDGLITTVTYLRGYGNTIIIDHGKDLYSVYAHIDDVTVTEDEYVDQGQLIAKVGTNGSLDGPKLHFEIWLHREKQDPEQWLSRSLAP